MTKKKIDWKEKLDSVLQDIYALEENLDTMELDIRNAITGINEVNKGLSSDVFEALDNLNDVLSETKEKVLHARTWLVEYSYQLNKLISYKS